MVGVILKEGLAGHSRCHTQKRICGGIVGVILKEGLTEHSRCHAKRKIGGALGRVANLSLSMTPHNYIVPHQSFFGYGTDYALPILLI